MNSREGGSDQTFRCGHRGLSSKRRKKPSRVETYALRKKSALCSWWGSVRKSTEAQGYCHVLMPLGQKIFRRTSSKKEKQREAIRRRSDIGEGSFFQERGRGGTRAGGRARKKVW